MVRLWGVETDDPAQHTPRRLGRKYAAALDTAPRSSGMAIVIAAVASWLAIIGTVAILSGIGRLIYVSLGGA